MGTSCLARAVRVAQADKVVPAGRAGLAATALRRLISSVRPIPEMVLEVALGGPVLPAAKAARVARVARVARLWQIGKEKLRLWPFPY